MRYVVEVLNELGLRADLKIVHDSRGVLRRRSTPGEPQAYLFGWSPDYPRASQLHRRPSSGAGRSPTSRACATRASTPQIDEAQRLQATDPAAANSAWTEIEHQLVEDAIWAPLTNPVSAYAFSARTENIQVHPQWGILLSRLWVQ